MTETAPAGEVDTAQLVAVVTDHHSDDDSDLPAGTAEITVFEHLGSNREIGTIMVEVAADADAAAFVAALDRADLSFVELTAELTSINNTSLIGGDWTRPTSYDSVAVRRLGLHIDDISVESSEEFEPYDAALAAAGYGGAHWLPNRF